MNILNSSSLDDLAVLSQVVSISGYYKIFKDIFGYFWIFLDIRKIILFFNLFFSNVL